MTKTLTALLLIFLTGVFFSESSIATETWKVVRNKEVCMFTNMHLARPQIPVEQAGKTYCGCCENCKAMIQTHAKSRVATDPHSKKSVDKSKAVIAANESGAVLYFESRASFDSYLAKTSKSK